MSNKKMVTGSDNPDGYRPLRRVPKNKKEKLDVSDFSTDSTFDHNIVDEPEDVDFEEIIKNRENSNKKGGAWKESIKDYDFSAHKKSKNRNESYEDESDGSHEGVLQITGNGSNLVALLNGKKLNVKVMINIFDLY